jgi:hypothetical protein
MQAGLVTVELALNGEELPGSPFPAEISAGPVSPASCTLEGPDLGGCVLGATCSFLMASRDSFGELPIAYQHPHPPTHTRGCTSRMIACGRRQHVLGRIAAEGNRLQTVIDFMNEG